MSGTADVIIIGAGHNGLITAFYLAKAGLRPLILESRDLTGGCVANESFAPGYQAPVANSIGPLRASVARGRPSACRLAATCGQGSEGGWG